MQSYNTVFFSFVFKIRLLFVFTILVIFFLLIISTLLLVQWFSFYRKYWTTDELEIKYYLFLRETIPYSYTNHFESLGTQELKVLITTSLNIILNISCSLIMFLLLKVVQLDKFQLDNVDR